MKRIFLLSPAHSGGKRAAMLIGSKGNFELARQVQAGAASLGDVFAFCSGLYFRGKLAYARHFADPPEGIAGVQIITPTRGVVAAETLIGIGDLCEFAEVPVDTGEPRFTGPLKDSIQSMPGIDSTEVILLGSVATGKYSDTLFPILGERLLFPADFAGRGDMSRGALLLRSAAANKELTYVSIARARRGSTGRLRSFFDQSAGEARLPPRGMEIRENRTRPRTRPRKSARSHRKMKPASDAGNRWEKCGTVRSPTLKWFQAINPDNA